MKQPVRQLSLRENVGDLQCSERRQLARFYDDGIARHQSHHDFIERRSPWKIPWRDDADDTEWFIDHVRRTAHQVVLPEADPALVQQAFGVLGKVVHEIESGDDLHRDCFSGWFTGFA